MRNYIEKVRQLFFTPTDFFTKVSKHKKLKSVALFYAFLLVFSAILNLLYFFVFTLYVNNVQLTIKDISQVLVSSLASVLIAIPLSFVWAFLLHSYLRIFKAKGDFIRTYQIFVYSSAPSLVLGWVPVVNLLASLYGIYLIYLGTVIEHKLSRRKSAIAYLLLLALLILYEALRTATG